MEVKLAKETDKCTVLTKWETYSLGDIVVKVGSGITPTGGEKVYKTEGRPFLRSQNIGWGCLLLDDIVFIDEETHGAFLSTEIKLKDVFLNITGASIGRSAVADNRLVGGNVNQHVCIIRADTCKLSPYYLNFFLLSKSGQKQIESFQAGGNRQGLNFGQIRSFQILIPPLPEQHAIATALSDTDALIASLDQLITKKRDMKQVTMQQLLTGRMRLPGFSGEWSSIALPDVCWFQEGPGVRNTQFTQSGVKLLNGTNIYRGEITLENTDRFISEKEAFGTYAHFLANCGDIIIACSGITIDRLHEKVAFVKEAHLPFCMNTSTMRFQAFNNYLLTNFLYYLLMSDIFKQQVGLQATGSAQLNFGPSHVANVVFTLPDLKEQIAIATILSDMDAEIVVLEQKREKVRALKYGMMQELLTGRIRLV